ncbi:hypothetical protein NR798_34915 [Archangium gephyra]|uniref:cyanobactin maturation protease PatG family protein n=1 Tax=Archangium gephyra TaxID=48 RepID=UPI0035D480C4
MSSTQAPAEKAAAEVSPSGCECGASAPGSQVFVLGTLGFDFVSRERRDRIYATNGRPIGDRHGLARYLLRPGRSLAAASDFNSIVWTLNIDGAPVYALQCTSPSLAAAFRESIVNAADTASPEARFVVAGELAGSASLLDGQVIPVIEVSSFRPLIDSPTAVVDAIQIAGAVAAAPAKVDLTAPSLDGGFIQRGKVTPLPGRPGLAKLTLSVEPPSTGAIPLKTFTYRGREILIADSSRAEMRVSSREGMTLSGAGYALKASLEINGDGSLWRMRVYFHTYDSTGHVSASVGSNRYAHTLIDSPQPVAGQPGAFDWVSSIVFRAEKGAVVDFRLENTPPGGAAQNPAEVIVSREEPPRAGAGSNYRISRAFGVGEHEIDLIAEEIDVPPGLRATFFADGQPTHITVGTGVTKVKNLKADILLVEPNCYVGIQAVTVEKADQIIEEAALQTFMDGLYGLLVNQGVSSRERAINFAAVQAATTSGTENLLAHALSQGLGLASIDASPAPLSRPGADVWDVFMVLCDPDQADGGARLVYRTTVDVAGVEPIQITPRRSYWTA